MMNSIARTLQKTILIFSASVLSLLSLPSFAQMSIEITGVVVGVGVLVGVGVGVSVDVGVGVEVGVLETHGVLL